MTHAPHRPPGRYPLRTLVLILAGSMLCLAAAHAQTPAATSPPTAHALPQYLVDHWGHEAGLPQLTVNAVVQTPDGYLWVGTEEGLARFDGVTFKVFDHVNTALLGQGAGIRTLYVDAAGRLWIGTKGGALVQYAAGRFVQPKKTDALGRRAVGSLVEGPDGALWIGTHDAGLFRAGSAGVAAAGPDSLHGKSMITALQHSRGGALWVGTHHGLWRQHDGHWTPLGTADGLPDPFVTALAEDRDGRLWIGTRTGLAYWYKGRLYPGTDAGFPTGVGVFALHADPQGALWVGTDGRGVARLQHGRFETFGPADGLAGGRVRALWTDHEGSLWVGTEGGGLNRLRSGKFTTLGEREGLAHAMAMTVFEDRDGTLWAGTEGGGLTRYRNGRATTFTTADGLASDVVLSLQGDPQGGLWVGTYGGGLNYFDGRRFRAYGRAQGLPSDAVFALHRGPSGTLWIGTDAGVARRDGATFKTYTTDDGLSSNLTAALLEDRRDGALWVGTVNAGLNRLQGGNVTHFGVADGLPGETVAALHQDRDGVLWIGTYGGGLARFRDGVFTTYTTREGLPSNNILQILEDDQGDFWISSNKGVAQLSRAAFDAVDAGTSASLAPLVFDRYDGLRSPEMTGGVQPAGWKGHDGTLWFPSVAGLAGIHPARARAAGTPPPMVLTAFWIDGVPQDPASRIQVPPGAKKVSFDFAALTFIAPEQVTYQYRLDGYDDTWSEATGTVRTATYTNLPPGDYTFHVRARTREGVWSEAAAVQAFTLEPFFYQTAWFALLCVLLVLAGAFGGYRWRIQQLKAREVALRHLVDERTRDLREAKDHIEAQAEKLRELDRFKTRFFANISHEFRTPLTLMIGPLENALSGAYGAVTDTLDQQMQVMLRNALRLLRLINQLLDLAKLESGKMNLHARPRNLAQFLEGITLSFTAFTEQKGIDLRFVCAEKEVPLYFEPDKLEKVFFNLLSNAVKFTPADGSITMSVEEAAPDAEAPDGYVIVRVRDTGMGIPESHLPYLFDRFHQVDDADTRKHEGTGIGLALVKELVLLHKGEVQVSSEPGKGTEFVVTLRKGKAHLEADQVELAPSADDDEPGHGAMIEMASADFNAMARSDQPVKLSTPAADDDAPLVLIIDDNPDILDYVGSCLHDRFRVATANNGQEGLDQAAALMPNLIISDIMMPGMTGYEMCRHLKADPALRHIPVILLSAKTSQQTIIEGLEHGADEYLAKPFNARELRVRIDNLLKLRVQERELARLNGDLQQQVDEQIQVILKERTAYEARLQAEKERAESAARLKSAILDNMSHELRTPMTAILGYSEILQAEVEEDHKEFADFINRNGRRLMDTLNAVIDLSRLEAAAVEPRATTFDVGDKIQEVCDTFAGPAAEKGLDLQGPAQAAPLQACFDPEALSRVLYILVDNAVKFTQSGSITISAEESDDQVTLRVHDTGIGISPDFMPLIFTPFQQESMGNNREFEGNGLNLSIAKRLVDLAGGAITVESQKGEGSCFTLSLPRRPQDRVISGDGVYGAAPVSYTPTP